MTLHSPIKIHASLTHSKHRSAPLPDSGTSKRLRRSQKGQQEKKKQQTQHPNITSNAPRDSQTLAKDVGHRHQMCKRKNTTTGITPINKRQTNLAPAGIQIPQEERTFRTHKIQPVARAIIQRGTYLTC
jgi:hypothetical protein